MPGGSEARSLQMQQRKVDRGVSHCRAPKREANKRRTGEVKGRGRAWLARLVVPPLVLWFYLTLVKVGEQRKVAAKKAGINFIPIVVETLGGWSSEAIQTITDIGRLQGQRLGITPGESIRHLFQRLAISLWRGNATLWINRKSTSPPRVDGFV